jgi:hypothetical protein
MASHTGSQSVVHEHQYAHAQLPKTLASNTKLLSTPVESQLKEAGSNSKTFIKNVPLPDPFWNPDTNSQNDTPFITRLQAKDLLFLQHKQPYVPRTTTAIPEDSIQSDPPPYTSLAPETPQDPLSFDTASIKLENLSKGSQSYFAQIKLEHTHSVQSLSTKDLSNFGQIGYGSIHKTVATSHGVSFADTTKQEPNNNSLLHNCHTLPYKCEKAPLRSDQSRPVITPSKHPTKGKRKVSIKARPSPIPLTSSQRSVRKTFTSPPPALVYSRLRPNLRRAAKLSKLQDSLRRVECKKKSLIVKFPVNPDLLRNLKVAGYIFPFHYNSIPKLFSKHYPLPDRFYSQKVKDPQRTLIVTFAVQPALLLHLELTGHLYPLPLRLNPRPDSRHPQAYTPSRLIDTVYPGYFKESMAPGVSKLPVVIYGNC